MQKCDQPSALYSTEPSCQLSPTERWTFASSLGPSQRERPSVIFGSEQLDI